LNEPKQALIERMRSRGLRLTWQRRLIAHLLENAETHLDAEEVFQLARRKDGRIHRATVYRTLHTLKTMGLIDELDLMHVSGDRHFYEVRPSEFHIHLVCMRCGAVAEPGGPFWQELKLRVQQETGFRPEVVRLEMGGTCVNCQGGGSNESR
jgi:Fur family ferric uptake transcriptional regulator